MGIARQHKGHTAAAAGRIRDAYDHYQTRAERRLQQVWIAEVVECYHAAAQPCTEDPPLHHIVIEGHWKRL
jgi:hypothetical protein